MRFITRKSIPRRTFLKGVGASFALPLLDAMIPAATAAAKTPVNSLHRLGYVFMPMGCDQSRWTPGSENTLDKLSPILDSLAPVKDKLTVFTNMEIENAYPGTHAIAFGHLGDGNVHFHVRAPQGVDDEAWYAGDGRTIGHKVYDIVDSYGGSISAEHGIGQAKLDALARLTGPGRMNALGAIKRALDPLGILNPGKILSLHG